MGWNAPTLIGLIGSIDSLIYRILNRILRCLPFLMGKKKKNGSIQISLIPFEVQSSAVKIEVELAAPNPDGTEGTEGSSDGYDYFESVGKKYNEVLDNNCWRSNRPQYGV